MLKAEIWGEHANGERMTDDPIVVSGMSDCEVIVNFISYIDGWISYHTSDRINPDNDDSEGSNG